MFGMLIAMAVPEKDELGIDLSLLAKCLVPLGCAFGVWLVGNIGREQGTFLRPLLACYATLPLHFYGGNMIAWTTIVGTGWGEKGEGWIGGSIDLISSRCPVVQAAMAPSGA